MADAGNDSENLRRLRAAYSGFASGDIPTLLAAVHSDVHWDASDALLHVGTYSGHDGVVQYLHSFAKHWEDFLLEPKDFSEPEPDTAVVRGRMIGHEKRTGRLLVADFVHEIQFRDGLVSEIRVHGGDPTEMGKVA